MTVETTPPPKKGAKAPGFVFTGLAAALAVLLIAALSPSQPPPPPIAEYAPEAVQAIKDAPPQQSAENGLAAGGDAGNSTARPPDAEIDPATGQPKPPTTTSTIKLPPNSERVRSCLGDPPRQTEDPQSPPCVPYFEGDNGGVTSMGVDANAIRLAFPGHTDDSVFLKLLAYFNKRFELYGRQAIDSKAGGCFGGSPSVAQNAARSVAKAQVFASTSFCDIMGSEAYYYDELANRGVISVNGRPYTANEDNLAKHHPYEWTMMPTFDKGARHLAELACALKDGNAAHAGPEFINTPRSYGLLENSYTDAPTPDYGPAKAALEACGIHAVEHTVQVERDSTAGQGATPATAQQMQSAVFDWRSKGVTTIIVLTHSNTTKQLYSLLDSQGYQPEIMLSGYLYNDEDLFISAQPQTQTAHTFGISTRNKQQAQVEDEFWWQAVNEIQPGFVWPYAPGTYFGARWDYMAMLVLFSGLQLAGPHLNPESFAAGMMRAKWPNPPHKNMPGKVTVSPGTHSFMEDAAIIWWSPSFTSEDYGQQGGFCYIDGGKRRRLGQYGKGDPGLFTTPCGR
ncbi:MAG: hypothetical protein QOK43_779 [Acidimicrobiaceae bacterium]|nr:hypothetical protein [Acidimicrobiaceae bacterium]